MAMKGPLYVGIDFSRSKTDWAVHQGDGQVLEKHRCFVNSLSGYQGAKQLVLKKLQEQAVQRVVMGGEATSYYWLPLYLQLQQDPDLADYQVELYLLNARWVHWFKKMSSPHHKDDSVDPGDIAEYLRFKQPDTPWQYDPRWLPLRFLTRLRYHLAHSLSREKNLFQLYLFLRYSPYGRLKPFSDVLGTTSRTLLEDPHLLEAFRQLPEEEQSEFLAQLAHHHLPAPERNAQGLRQVLADSFPLPPELDDPIQFGLQRLLDCIEQFEHQIALVEERIAAQAAQGYPEITWLESIPGIGLVTASGIAAEIGNLQRFQDLPIFDPRRQAYRQRSSQELVDAISKYAGLWWPKNASGQFEAEERHMSREGNAYLRFYILEAAERLRQRIPSFRAYYQKKYAQATKHHHKRALVLTGCKALDLCVTLLRRKEAYKPKEGDRPA